MKVKKEALRAARLLLKASMPGGRVDTARASELTRRIVAEKPRHSLQILQSYRRLLRLELDKRHAVIESATPLDDAARAGVLSELTSKFGTDLTSEFILRISSAVCASNLVPPSGMVVSGPGLNLCEPPSASNRHFYASYTLLFTFSLS